MLEMLLRTQLGDKGYDELVALVKTLPKAVEEWDKRQKRMEEELTNLRDQQGRIAQMVKQALSQEKANHG